MALRNFGTRVVGFGVSAVGMMLYANNIPAVGRILEEKETLVGPILLASAISMGGFSVAAGTAITGIVGSEALFYTSTLAGHFAGLSTLEFLDIAKDKKYAKDNKYMDLPLGRGNPPNNLWLLRIRRFVKN